MLLTPSATPCARCHRRSRAPPATAASAASARADAAPPPAALHRRRAVLAAPSLLLLLAPGLTAAAADDGAAADDAPLCDAACEAAAASAPRVALPSGLAYQDLVSGRGPTPIVGQQVVVDYVVRTAAEGRQIDSARLVTLRVVGGGKASPAPIEGLNEGLKTMQPGGVRRLFVPGALAFPKGLPSGPGRPRVPPLSDVVFDVRLRLIPGLDYD